MARPLSQSVVVVTGASSGIGRAAARAFARRGATVVLAARREKALQAALEECEGLGGRGLAVQTDVGEAEQVDRLADQAVAAYDRIDVWVNNAAVSLFGRLEELPPKSYEQVIRTNLVGYFNGARAAIRQFREQGEGRLVNVSSVVGHVGQPFTSAYVASKWGIRALSECLRMELKDAPGISVSTVMPASIDTPIFQSAGNYMGRPGKPMGPVYPPEQAADAIVRVAERPAREVYVGGSAHMLAAMRSLCPSIAESMMARQTERDHFKDAGVAAPSDGNLFAPIADGRGSARGGWLWRDEPTRSPGPSMAGVALALALVAVPIGLYAMSQRQGR